MAWGDKIDEFAIRNAETITASVNLESREYNGRWYTDVKAWRVSRDGIGADDGARDSLASHGSDLEGSNRPLDDEIPF